MTELDDRLVRCVSSVFPHLSDEEILKSDVLQLMGVDSLAAVTLIAVINDEFGVDLDLEELQKLGSFQAIRHCLDRQNNASSRSGESRVP